MHEVEVRQHVPRVGEEVLALARGNAEQTRQLRQADDDRGGVDEPHENRVRQQIEEHSEPQRAEGDLEEPRQQREDHRALHERVTADVGERGQARGGE